MTELKNMNPSKSIYPLRLTIAAFLAFFAAALLPRLSLILSGASYADDWGHPYTGHLVSYRPIAALELWTMQSIFGPDYLTFKLPKILSAFWYALSLTVLMRVARQFGVPTLLFALLGVAALFHPITNELVLWGVLSTLAFVTFLSVLGAALVLLGTSTVWRLIGIVLLCLGAAGSQIEATIGACLVIADLAHRGIRGVLADGRKELGWRVAVVLLPPVFALVVLLYMRFGLGYVDFASRSIGLSSTTLTGWLHDKFYVYSNAIANLYQAPLGVAFGRNIALRAFWPAVALPVPMVYLVLAINKVPIRTALGCALAVPAILIVALSPLLGANAMPTGYRILGGPLLMLVVAIALPLSLIWHKPAWRNLSFSAIALAAAAFLWASTFDIQVRRAAWKQDLAWLADARTEFGTGGMKQVQLCSWRFKPPTEAPAVRTGIIVSYGTANALNYSVWYTQFLASFLRVQGFNAAAPEMNEDLEGCTAQCAAGGTTRFGPFRIRSKADGSTAYVCE